MMKEKLRFVLEEVDHLKLQNGMDGDCMYHAEVKFAVRGHVVETFYSPSLEALLDDIIEHLKGL